jgi:hypothetical protein
MTTSIRIKFLAACIGLVLLTAASLSTQILRSAGRMSDDTVNNLVQQSELLQRIVSIFKVN